MPTPARRRTAARLLPTLALALVATSACGGNEPDASRATSRPASSTAAPPTADPPSSAPSSAPSAAPTPPLPPALARTLDDGPRRARTPAQVAGQIRAAEDAIADPRTPADVLEAAGHLQQVAYRVLGARPAWDRRVRVLLPARLHADVAANVASRREFESMQYSLSDTLPAWRIVRPEPARALLGHYRAAERRFGVDWEYLAAINLVETGMGRIRGTSVAGAQGPMQFIPATWAQYGRGDVNDPRDAVMAAARYLDARGFNERGGIPDALHAYNNHDAYVRGVTRLAEVVQRDPRAFLGYYHWKIYYTSTRGDVLLPVGYAETESVPVGEYLARG